MRLRISTLLSLLLSLDAATAQAVLGFDVGQSFIKAALVKPGIPLEIVLTRDSKRKEVNAIAFKPSGDVGTFHYHERLYGPDAANLAARFPDAVFPNLKMLLGKEMRDDAKDIYTSRNPALTLFPIGPRDAIGFKTGAAPPDSDGVFTVEELVAMQLKSVVQQAEIMAGGNTKIKDAVFAIPAYWKGEERVALKTAAELAGLKVKGLITDGLAVGLNYAVTRNFEVDKPEYHVVYDMGAGSSTATILKFQGKKVKDVGRFNKTVQDISVVGFGADEGLGGDVLNDKMVDILVEEFLKTKKAQKVFGEDPNAASTLRRNGRTAAKLWKEATRARQILSANTETYSSVESLYEDIDFRSEKLTRAEFEERLAEYQARITQPIVDALAAAKLTLDDISSVILHGGAIRTPYVAKQLEGLVGANRISKNVNSDEAAVFGAAFRAAGLSGSFKVKEIHIHDSNPHPISIEYLENQEASDPVSKKIFSAGSPPGKEKVITVPRSDDFDFIILHEFPGKWRNKEFLSKVSATNVTASVNKLVGDYKCAQSDIKTRFTFKLSALDGLPDAINGWVECEIEEVEEKKEEGFLDGVKDFLGVGKDKDSSSSSSSSSSTKTSSSKSASSTPEPPKITKKIIRHPLALTSRKLGKPALTDEERKELLNVIAAFDRTDANRHALEESRNNFESYAYSALSHLSDTPAFLAAVDEETQKSIKKLAEEATEWLYSDDPEASSLDVVKKKFSELKKIHSPVVARMKEHEARPEAVRILRDAVDELKEVLGVVEDKTDAGEIEKLLDESVGWLEKTLGEQEKTELWKEPVLKVKEIEAKVKVLKDKVVKTMEKRMRAQLEKKIKEEEERKKKEKEEKEAKKAEEEKKKAEEKEKQEEAKSEETKPEEATEEVKEDAEKKEEAAKEQVKEEKEKEHIIDEL